MANLGDVDGAIEMFLGLDELRPLEQANGRTAALEMTLTSTDAEWPRRSSACGIDYLSLLSADLEPHEPHQLPNRGPGPALRPSDGTRQQRGLLLPGRSHEGGARRAPHGSGQGRQLAPGREPRTGEGPGAHRVELTAYERASALMPHDGRVANDTGLIMAYYKRTDPDLAETYFQRSIVDGAVQLEIRPDR